jgi:hypothetical protein
MSNGDDWADISDGGDDDWEMGEPVAPDASGSSSGSFGSGSNGGVSTASRSHHRPQSSWGADDDWGGDEENWHPGPANLGIPSLSNLRGSRRGSPPRSPALTKGVSPARPAKGSRRWTRSRAACRRLGVLACLVAAVVTLSSFGIFKGGGSGAVAVDAWETRPEGDAFERTARSFEERRTSNDATSRAGDEMRFRAAPAATRAPVSETVVRRVPIGTMTDARAHKRVSDELARLKGSHEHVSNAADATDLSRVAPAFPTSEESAERSDERSDGLAASRSEPDSALVPIETGAEVVLVDAIEADGNAEDTFPSDGALDDVATSSVFSAEAEDDADDAADDVFGEVVDAEEDEAPRDAREAPRDAEDGSRDAALASPRDAETGAASSTVVFGEVVDGDGGDGASTSGEENASWADADFSVSAEAFAGAFGDTREEASVNDADIMTTPNDDEASETETEAEIEAGDEASDATERHEDDTKGFGSVEDVSLRGSSSSTNAVASERSFPNTPPPPPPVPMDGPDMTDPANRARLDAYQSRAKYVAWSKKTAKLEGRVVAPPDAETRR